MKHISHILLLLSSILVFSCGTKSIKPIRSFQLDSLQVVELLNKGDSLYALRNGFNTIAESMVYFDSANRIAKRINDTLLLANTLYFIGNVYNAWNKEPQTTVNYYLGSSALYNGLPHKIVRGFYLRYLISHAYDCEKLNDSLRSVHTVETALHDLQQLPDSTHKKMNYLSDFAWVATNNKAYNLAEKVLTTIAPRSRIVNDPESNNYLDHYYLTRSRIDVYKYQRRATPYLDSVIFALQQCNNRFDSGYYTLNLSELYAASGSNSQAYYYLKLNQELQKGLDNSTVLTALQKELLTQELQAGREKELRTKEELKNKNLYLVIMSLALLTIGLAVFLSLLHRRRIEEWKEAVRQQQFTNLLLQNVEVERRRIASDLHDGINHELLNLKNNLYFKRTVSTTDVEFIITSVREVSRNLYPALFETVGLAASVQALCERMQEAGFFTTTEINYVPTLTKEQELQVYRIIQEALTNVAKHARAEACKITIETSTDQFWVEIKDNGKGFETSSREGNKASFGLQSMHQRARVLEAKLNIDSKSSGTVITLKKQF